MAAQNEAIQAFHAGTNSIFRQWTALELAVHNQWGGHNSEEKANAMINEVLELFGGSQKIYKDVRQSQGGNMECMQSNVTHIAMNYSVTFVFLFFCLHLNSIIS